MKKLLLILLLVIVPGSLLAVEPWSATKMSYDIENNIYGMGMQTGLYLDADDARFNLFGGVEYFSDYRGEFSFQSELLLYTFGLAVEFGYFELKLEYVGDYADLITKGGGVVTVGFDSRMCK